MVVEKLAEFFRGYFLEHWWKRSLDNPQLSVRHNSSF